MQPVCPADLELTDEDREQAAKPAIDDAFVAESKSSSSPQITEEALRKQFPE